MKRAIAFLGLVSVLVSTSLAVFPNLPDASFREVGQMGNIVSGNFSQSATGVVVSPEWILTASHVGGTHFRQDGIVYPILQRINHTGPGGQNADIALCRVAGPLRYAAPMSFRPFSGAGGLQGTTMTIVGFGQTATRVSTGWSIQGGTSGTRRAANNAIDLFATVQLQVGAEIKTSDCIIYDLDDPLGQNTTNVLGGTAVPNEGGMASGDSGGGWFVNEAGRMRIVGVNSFVGTLGGTGVVNWYDWGGVGGAVHLNSYQTWLRSNVLDLGRTIFDSLTMQVGSVVSGGLPQTYASDDQRLRVTSPNLSDAELAFVWGFVIGGTTTASPASALDIRIEGSSISNPVLMEVALRNWTTGFFEVVDLRFLNTFEQLYQTLNIPATNYVRADGRVELQVHGISDFVDANVLLAEFDMIRVDVR